MAANWGALARYLEGQADVVTLTWRELDEIVGGVPASATKHAAWWSKSQPHARGWRSAGFEVESRSPGYSVTFRRRTAPTSDGAKPTADALPAAAIPDGTSTDAVLLIACGKSKLSGPAAAKDLYTSPRFRKARQFAEASQRRWYILSAEHGLVRPDDWLAPYERFLSDTPRTFRAAWGEWVAARLELEGDLDGTSVEIHAGEDYVVPLEEPLARRGATLVRPLRGLTLGQWSQWYDERSSRVVAEHRTPTYDGPTEPWVELLGDASNSVAPVDFVALERDEVDGPGLYAWFVDEEGAPDLSAGLGHEVLPGLIYVGQTGATKWPSGTASGSTLLKRIRSQHLGGNRGSSTLRRTLGAVLDSARGASVSRDDLTAWMFAHLRVIPAVVSEPDCIADLERRVVQTLDPPLNLDHTQPSALRVRLRELRSKPATLP